MLPTPIPPEASGIVVVHGEFQARTCHTCGHCWRPRSWVTTLGGFLSFLNCCRHQWSATGWKRGNGPSHSCFKSPFSPYGFPAPGLTRLDLREKTHGAACLPLVACRAAAAAGLQLQSGQPGRREAFLIPSSRCLLNCFEYYRPYEIYYFCTDVYKYTLEVGFCFCVHVLEIKPSGF